MPIASTLVGVGVAHAGEAVLVGESDHARVPRPPERCRVERLDGVRPEARSRRRGAGAGRSPGRTAGTARADGPGWRGRPGRGSRRSSSAASWNGLTGCSIQRARRWPPRVVTSSPTTTSTGRPRSRAMRPPRDGRVDPLVVRDRDDVELGVALDVVEDLDDAGGPVRGERVDVQVGAAAAVSRVGHAARARSRLPAARSGQIGWNGPPLLRGGARSGARTRAAIGGERSVVTRSRRVPSAGTGTPPPRRGNARRIPPHAEHVDRDARLEREQRRTRRERRRRAEERTAIPPPVMSRSPSSPTVSPRSSAPLSSRFARPRARSARRPAGGACAHEVGLELGIRDRLHGHHRGRPVRLAATSAGSSNQPMCSPTKREPLGSASAASTISGFSNTSQRSR